VRLYTNADLDRVHPLRGETGALSTPAATAAANAVTSAPRGRGEAHWRREAAKVRERQRTLAQKVEVLRARLAESSETGRRLSRRGRSAASASSEAALRARVSALEQRHRQLDEDLADRARRDGALPGWLR
jgi:hypothetical protein